MIKQFTLRDLLWLVVVIAISVAYLSSSRRLEQTESELATFRAAHGYLAPSPLDEIAAVRAPTEQPMTYRVRVRVPNQPRYRVAYSSLWEKDETAPSWYAAVELPEGESTVIVRILKDPRDELWKITTLVQSESGTKRMATVLPEDQVSIFKKPHDAISAGVGKQTVSVAKTSSLRLLDEKWLVGEGPLMLYGNKPPSRDQIGIYAELQPDVGTL